MTFTRMLQYSVYISLSKVTLQLSGNREGSNSITIYINYNI